MTVDKFPRFNAYQKTFTQPFLYHKTYIVYYSLIQCVLLHSLPSMYYNTKIPDIHFVTSCDITLKFYVQPYIHATLYYNRPIPSYANFLCDGVAEGPSATYGGSCPHPQRIRVKASSQHHNSTCCCISEVFLSKLKSRTKI